MLTMDLPTFQSTPPARGATVWTIWKPLLQRYFNPRPPRGGRPWKIYLFTPPPRHFNPRPPRGGRHYSCNNRGMDRRFQSTPPARGATPSSPHYSTPITISIHAPREGGDSGCHLQQLAAHHFNPRPPRGGRPSRPTFTGRLCTISIHAPREGGDSHCRRRHPWSGPISIHAPREGGDTCRLSWWAFWTISIHAPREGGDKAFCARLIISGFQSTPPARGATQGQQAQERPCPISIHAPREGGDKAGGLCRSPHSHFNPRPPRGGRLTKASGGRPVRQISIHAPREGGDAVLRV